MKHRVIIWAILMFILLMVVFWGWIMKTALGEEVKKTKTIVLCFDDGPRPQVLKELLPLLENYDIPASFFMEGDMILLIKNSSGICMMPAIK